MAVHSYGLMDWDLLNMTGRGFFNLDMMKVSSYLKRNSKIVKTIETIDPSVLPYYNKVLIFKNNEDNYYPTEFFNAPNVEVYGDLIEDGVSMLPTEVENARPDIYLYHGFQRYFDRNQLYEQRFDLLMNSVHLRMSQNGKDINPKWLKPFHEIPPRGGLNGQTFLIHDANPTKIDNAWEAIDELADRDGHISPHFFWFKSPLVFYDDKTFLAWRGFKKRHIIHTYDLHFLPSWETLFESVKMKTTAEYLEFKANGGEKSLYRIYIPHDYPVEKFKKDIFGYYMFALYARRRHTNIELMLPYQNYLDPDWNMFLNTLNYYWNTVEDIVAQRGIKRITFYRFLRHMKTERLPDGSLDTYHACQRVIPTLERRLIRALRLYIDLEYDGRQVIPTEMVEDI